MPENQNINEMWTKFVREKYPNMTDWLIEQKRIQAACDWSIGYENEMSELYDKYVMYNRLLDINPQAESN